MTENVETRASSARKRNYTGSVVTAVVLGVIAGVVVALFFLKKKHPDDIDLDENDNPLFV